MTASKNLISYRLAKDSEEDATEYCKLYSDIFLSVVDVPYYRWQFFETPFPAYIIFAEVNNTVVASIGVLVKRVEPSNANVLNIVDMMVSKEYRGQGIFRRLISLVEEYGKEYSPIACIVMANLVGRDAICRCLGWEEVTEFKTFICTDKIDTTRTDKISYEVKPCSKNSFNTEPIYFHNQHTLRDLAYYDWRFCKHTKYKYFKLHNKYGYAVVKIFNDKHSEKIYGDIVEVFAKEEKGYAILAGNVVDYFSKKNVNSIATWGQTNLIWDQAILNYGFEPIDQYRYFCVKVLNNEFCSLLESKKWIMQLSDTELY